MRHTTLCLGLFAVVLAGCAHAREEVRPTTVTAAPETSEREVIAIDSAPPPEVVPVARPRLAQTITLGQGAEQPYIPAAPPQARAGGASASSNVVVNNNIVVQGGAPAYYGGGYGYGRSTSFYGGESRSFGATPSTTPQWGATGWEGARRTAAPGQTPGVGGNWSPAPSYGPAQMK